MKDKSRRVKEMIRYLETFGDLEDIVQVCGAVLSEGIFSEFAEFVVTKTNVFNCLADHGFTVVKTLRKLKMNDREDVFNEIERLLVHLVPKLKKTKAVQSD